MKPPLAKPSSSGFKLCGWYISATSLTHCLDTDQSTWACVTRSVYEYLCNCKNVFISFLILMFRYRPVHWSAQISLRKLQIHSLGCVIEVLRQNWIPIRITSMICRVAMLYLFGLWCIALSNPINPCSMTPCVSSLSVPTMCQWEGEFCWFSLFFTLPSLFTVLIFCIYKWM